MFKFLRLLYLQPIEGRNKTKTTTSNGSKNRKWKITGLQVRDRWCPCKTSSSLEKTNSIEACVNTVLRNLNSPGYNNSSEPRGLDQEQQNEKKNEIQSCRRNEAEKVSLKLRTHLNL